MYSDDTQSQSDFSRTEKLDAKVWELEERLVRNPDDSVAARELVTILDYHLPSKQGVGAFTDCQRMIADQYRNNDWSSKLLNLEEVVRHYSRWQSDLDAMNVRTSIAITQLLVGNFIAINGAEVYCNQYLALFKKEEIIPKICHDCFKVQIIPHNLSALIQTYFVIEGLKLSRDNARKCMVELREDVKYPYKGYIYCESENEVEFCLIQLQSAFRQFGVSNIHCGISHGCSEYGLRYPKFKYSQDGSHRSFERPESWNKTDAQLLSSIQKFKRIRVGFNKQGISIRDIIGFQTWIKYAAIIGDDTYKLFVDTPTATTPTPFAARVEKQAELRKAQLEELQEMPSFD